MFTIRSRSRNARRFLANWAARQIALSQSGAVSDQIVSVKARRLLHSVHARLPATHSYRNLPATRSHRNSRGKRGRRHKNLISIGNGATVRRIERTMTDDLVQRLRKRAIATHCYTEQLSLTTGLGRMVGCRSYQPPLASAKCRRSTEQPSLRCPTIHLRACGQHPDHQDKRNSH